MARVVYEFGPFQMDPSGRRLTRNGEAVPLTPKALDTLTVLLTHRDRRLSREELIAQVWPDTNVGQHNLNQCIAVLRKTLDDNAREPRYIATLPGHGYAFVAEVRVIGNGASSDVATVSGRNLEPPDEHLDRASTDVPNGSRIIPQPPTQSSPARHWRWLAIFVIAAALGIPLSRLIRAKLASAHVASITVLPFIDLGGDPNQAYVAEGITNELSAELAQIRGLKVLVSPQLHASTIDLQEIAERLGVDIVLKGTLRREQDQYRLTIQLVRGSDGRELWAGLYDADIAQIPAIEDQVVHHTADTLRFRLPANLDQQLARRRAENPRAHQLYLQGRYFWSRRDSESMARSLELFQEAIRLDPSYALAYAGLADSYAVLANNDPNPADVPLAAAAANKAMELDPSLAEPHAALGLLKAGLEWDHDGAKMEFARALELDPANATAHHWAGLNLISMGQFEAADAELRKAQELDPLSPMISEGRFENFYRWRRFDDAITAIHELQAQNPDRGAHFYFALGEGYAAKGQYAEAMAAYRKHFEIEPDNDGGALRLARIQALAGDQATARATLQKIESKGDPTLAALYARVHIALGENDAALTWLQRELAAHNPDVLDWRWDIDFDPIRNDPRFLALSREADHQSAPANR